MALDGSLRGRRLLATQGRHHQRVIAQQVEPLEIRHEVVGGLVRGHRQSSPASRNVSSVGIGSASVVSTIALVGTWVRNVPRWKRIPTLRLPAR